VHYTQFMGKDNVPFHTVVFPATLLGSGRPWKMVDTIKGFNWLTYYGGKFSTSENRGVFMDQALEIYPADYWRYYLMSNVPENNDTEFTWESFGNAVNKDLADVLGNFAQRVQAMVKKHFGLVIPEGAPWGEEEDALCETVQAHLTTFETAMDALELRKAMVTLRALWKLGNEYVDEAAPWSLLKNGEKEKAGTVLAVALNLLRLYAILGSAIIPNATATILESLQDPKPAWPASAKSALTALSPGHAFTPTGILFQKIAEKDLAAHQERFGGTR